MSDTYHPDLIGQGQCVHGCRDARKGLICTDATEVVDTGNQTALCPVDATCDDAVMHRTADRDWHTCSGTTPEQWWADRQCPHGPDCDPSDELANPGDPWTTHTVCLAHDQDPIDQGSAE